MYIPAFNKFPNQQEAISFMQAYSFATIVSVMDGLPVATHLPFIIKQEGDKVILSSHFAKANPQAHELAGKKVLVSMTTGAPEFTWKEEKRGTIKDIFKHMFVGVFGLCGMHLLEPFIVYGAKRQTLEDKETTFRNLEKRLNELVA